MTRPLTPVELDEVRGELAHRGKVPALALYRELTGAALPEAMAFIDRLTASAPPPPAHSLRELDAVEMRELRGLLMDGGLVAAVRYYREKTGASPEQARAFAEDQGRKMERDAPPLPRRLLDLSVEALAGASDRDARLAELRAGVPAQWSDAQRLAAMRRAEEMLALAGTLCEQYRDGTLKEPDVRRALRAGAPGFGGDAYGRAFDRGMRDTL